MDSKSVGLLLNYRDSRRSIACATSLLSQPIANVLIWDNSEDDGQSAALIKECFKNEPRVAVNICKKNIGFSAGVNRGLAYCKKNYAPDYVLLINNDALLLPGALSKLTHKLVTHPNAKIAHSGINHAGKVIGLSYYHRLTGLLSNTCHPGSFPYASGCCLMIALNQVTIPLLDEDFFMYGEDAELGWRWHDQPDSRIFIDEVLAVHEGAVSSGLGSQFYEERMVAAHLILARKLARNRADKIILYIVHSLMLMARAIIRSTRFHSLVPFRALWHGANIACTKALPHDVAEQ